MAYRRTEAREVHAQQVRDAFIDAAEQIIRADGIDAVTVRAVVERAGGSIGNYYHHFGDRERLLVALTERVIERMEAAIDGAAGRSSTTVSEGRGAGSSDNTGTPSVRDLAQSLTAMVSTGVQAALEDRELTAPLFSGAIGRKTRSLVVNRFLERTERFFGQVLPRAQTREIDLSLLATLWQGPILLIIERALAGELDVEPSVAARECAAWNLRALGVV